MKKEPPYSVSVLRGPFHSDELLKPSDLVIPPTPESDYVRYLLDQAYTWARRPFVPLNFATLPQRTMYVLPTPLGATRMSTKPVPPNFTKEENVRSNIEPMGLFTPDDFTAKQPEIQVPAFEDAKRDYAELRRGSGGIKMRETVDYTKSEGLVPPKTPPAKEWHAEDGRTYLIPTHLVEQAVAYKKANPNAMGLLAVAHMLDHHDEIQRLPLPKEPADIAPSFEAVSSLRDEIFAALNVEPIATSSRFKAIEAICVRVLTQSK